MSPSFVVQVAVVGGACRGRTEPGALPGVTSIGSISDMRQLDPSDIWELKLPSQSPHTNSPATAGTVNTLATIASEPDIILHRQFTLEFLLVIRL